MRRALGAVLAAAALALASGCGGSSGDAASYGATDMGTGDDVSVEDLQGRPVLLVSWATWCAECDELLGGLQAFANSPAAEGVEVVAVNLDASDTDEIDAKIDEHGLTTGLWRDRRNEFKSAFGALGVPTSVVIDVDGAVVASFPGAVDFAGEDVSGALDTARAGSS
jgi:thioredoxin-like negative regulator of GroEL